MLGRPTPKDEENDLLKQNREFQERLRKESNLKRKQNGNDETVSADQTKDTKKKTSKFARKRNKKETVINYTHIQEIEANEQLKNVCLGEIQENVEAFGSQPQSTRPQINTQIPPKMTIEQMEDFEEQQSLPQNAGKTIYQLHMESLEMWKVTEQKPKEPEKQDDFLKNLESQGSLHPDDLLNRENLGSIHTESMNLLSSWSHEQRIHEANELMTKLDPEVIEAIKNRRQKKVIKKEMEAGDSLASEVAQMDLEPERKVPEELKQNENWLHMDKVEKEKMKWMTELPPPKPLKQNEGFVARFNFEGELLPYNSEISVNEGLHHHGDEPERAGYSIDEIFLLARSRVIQQRHVGLKILGNILRNSKLGLFDGCFDTPILQLLVDAGVVFLLRFAIDDGITQVYQEALKALYHLVSSDADEKCLYLLESWSPHHVVPGISSRTHHKEKDRKELDEEESELADTEIIKLDLIRALSRMDILPRLRYFIDKMEPAPLVLSHIFGILIRMARHSLSIAWDIANCTGLIESIQKHFLPTKVSDDSPVETLEATYGVPFRPAITLLKVLSQRGRELANIISRLPGLMETLSVYMTMDHNRIRVPVSVSLSVTVESFALLSVLLSYGHVKPQETFRSVFPLLMKQLNFYREQVDVHGPSSTHDIGTHVIRLLTVGLLVSSTESLLTARRDSNQPSRQSNGKPEVLVPPVLQWKEIEVAYPVVTTCLDKWVSQLQGHDVTAAGYRMIGAACRFTEVFIENWIDQSTFDVNEAMRRTNFIQRKIVAPYLVSEKFIEMVENASKYSTFTSNRKTGVSRDPLNLDSIGSITHGGEIIPIIHSHSPFPFLYSLSSLIVSLIACDPSLIESWGSLRIREIFNPYVIKLMESSMSLASNWFSRIELHTFVNFAKVVAKVDTVDDGLQMASLKVLPYVQKHDEHLIKTLLVDVIGSVPLSDRNLSYRVLCKDLINEVTEKSSLILQRSVPFLINTFTVDFHEGFNPLYAYWPLNPLRNGEITKESVLTCLCVASLILKRIQSVCSVDNKTGWYRHISKVFLHESDIFHDNMVGVYLEECLKEILKDGGCSMLNHNDKIEGLPSSLDWYKSLVSEFGDRSYGNRIFSLYIVVPLIMSWPVEFRDVLWSENSVVLSFITISCDDVSEVIPINHFTEPRETNESLLLAYKRYLASPEGRIRKSDFLYRVASYHTSGTF